MQTSKSFDWGHIVPPLRLTIRVLSVLWAVVLGYLQVRATMAHWQITGSPPEVLSSVFNALAFAGILLAVFWKEIGEIIGGLVTIGAVVVLTIVYGPSTLLPLGPFIVFSVLFIACGWYTRTQQSRSPTPTIA